jgi:hypothetical protein
MFADYLRLTYLLPLRVPEDQAVPPGYVHAHRLWEEYTHCGERSLEKELGAHKVAFHNYPEGIRCILDFGGSVLPVDNNDFLRKFRAFKHWTISRLDLATNLERDVLRSELRIGQAVEANHHVDYSRVDGVTVENWHGCTIGVRGRAAAVFRVYDCKKHEEGKAAKISRFGHYDFWRAEYEMSREYFRRKGINTFGQLTPELMELIWSNESYNKGVDTDEAEYCANLIGEPIPKVENDMAQNSRLAQIWKMVEKLDLERMTSFILEVQTRERELIETAEKNTKKLDPDK